MPTFKSVLDKGYTSIMAISVGTMTFYALNMPTVETPANFVRRHGKRFKVPSCLQIMHLEISAVGMVSALKYHHAYGKVHFSGYTVGTLRQFLYHHAYKIYTVPISVDT